MQEVTFDIPVGDGKAHAKLYYASGIYGLTLHDGTGLPMGKGRSLSDVEARHLAKAIEQSKPSWRAGLIWAALGYERTTRRAIASALCHPGTYRLHGRA